MLVIKTKTKRRRDFKGEINCRRYDGQQMNYVESLSGTWFPDTTPTTIYKEEVREYLVTCGEYIFDIRIREGDKVSERFTISNFSILERDKVVPYIYFVVFSGIVGSGLTLLIQWLIGLGGKDG